MAHRQSAKLERVVSKKNLPMFGIFHDCVGVPRIQLSSILKVNPPKQGSNSNQNKGHLGSRYVILLVHDRILPHPLN